MWTAIITISDSAAVGAIVVILVVAAIAAMVWASASIGSGVYVKALCRARTDRKVVALTFDDGPDPELTPRILDTLARHDAKATFFIVGEKASAHPEIVKRIVDEGHLVGNHTYGHSSRFPMLNSRQMREELQRCDAVIEKITGYKPTLFRPPFGVTNPPLARAVCASGYTVAGWSIRSLDTVSRWTRTKIFGRVRRRLRPGTVILLHDDRKDGDTLLEMILNHMESNGYKVERFDKLFGL